GDLPDIVANLAATGWVLELEQQFTGAIDVDAIFANLGDWVSDPKNVLSVGGGVVSIGAGILSFITGAIIVVILTIYFALTMPTIKRARFPLVAASPPPTVGSATEDLTRSIGRSLLGQPSLGIVTGACSASFLALGGAPLPALRAFVAFLPSLRPL